MSNERQKPLSLIGKLFSKFRSNEPVSPNNLLVRADLNIPRDNLLVRADLNIPRDNLLVRADLYTHEKEEPIRDESHSTH